MVLLRAKGFWNPRPDDESFFQTGDGPGSATGKRGFKYCEATQGVWQSTSTCSEN